MGNIVLFLSYLFLLSSSTMSKHNNTAKTHLRTDGFYLYDNGIDTISIIPDGKKMQLDMLHMMQSEGYIDSLDFTDTTLLDAKNTHESTNIHFLAFFDDTVGVSWGTIFRREHTLDSFLFFYHNSKTISNQPKEFRIHHKITKIVAETDSTFSFTTGENDRHFEKNYLCLFRENRLHIRMKYRNAPWYNSIEYDYIFIPFSSIPRDLLIKNKK